MVGSGFVQFCSIVPLFHCVWCVCGCTAGQQTFICKQSVTKLELKLERYSYSIILSPIIYFLLESCSPHNGAQNKEQVYRVCLLSENKCTNLLISLQEAYDRIIKVRIYLVVFV